VPLLISLIRQTPVLLHLKDVDDSVVIEHFVMSMQIDSVVMECLEQL
jgi:hypothetical protein